MTLGAELNYVRTETELLGESFSFSPGAVDGVTELWILRATQSFVQQRARQVIAFRSTATVGLDAIEPAVATPLTPPSDYFAWLGQAQFARIVNDDGHRLSGRLDLQVATDALFPTEKFAFGGQTTVRGYRMNQTLSDNGIVASAEYAAPVASLIGGEGGVLDGLTVSTFVDAGYGWNDGEPDPANDLLVSVGVGLRWLATDGVAVEASWAARLENPPPVVDRGPQDWGLGFRIIVDPFALL